MIEQRKVLIQSDSKLMERTIEFTTSEPWELRLLSDIGGAVEYSCNGSDLFECLSTLRKQYLEKQKCKILVNGARLDVYPSRMSRQMSGGRKAYVMRLGEPAKRTDIIDIFDKVEDISRVATLAEQREFNKKWLDSLG